MVWQRLEGCSRAISKCKEWTDPKTFNPKRLRAVLAGTILNITIAEVCAYKILQQDVVVGELGSNVPDMVIIFVSCFEGFIAPFVSWWGYKRRRLTLALWMLAAMVGCWTWLALPDPTIRTESEFCDAANQSNDISYSGLSRVAVTRLAMVTTTALVFVMARVAIWSHGIGYCEEYSPERISVHYGLILNIRAISLLIGYKFLTTFADKNLKVQIIILVVSFVPNVIQIPLIMPRGAEGELPSPLPDYAKGLLHSIARVCSNALAITQMFAMGLLATALWGYGYYEADIIRVKFLLTPIERESNDFVQIIQYFFIFFILMFAATRFAAPVLKEYSKRKAIKQVIIMTMFVVVMFVVITILPMCDKGEVIGLGDDYYGHPECSYECGCRPQWQEFFPVCAVDNMETYLSPCHAGCSSSETVNGVNVFVNCTCSTARVLAGACSDDCQFALDLHNTIFLILITFALMAFQAQGVLVLKSVDSRDKSVVLGLASSMVAIIAFVCGPLIYLGIEAGSCRWYEGDRCHLLSQSFPKTIGYTSTFIASMAALVCIVTSICIRLGTREYQHNDECKRNDQGLSEDTVL